MTKYTKNDLKYPNNLKSVDWIKNEKEVVIENNVIVSDCDFYCKKPRRLQGDTINDVISFCIARYMPCQDYDICYYKQLQKLKSENVKRKSLTRNCETCKNFDIESMCGVCCKKGVLNDVIENCKDYEAENG